MDSHQKQPEKHCWQCFEFGGWLKQHDDNLFSLFDAFDLDKDISVLVLAPTGVWVYEGSGHPYQVEDDFAAIGSGAQAALAAMQLGKAPRKAVEVASLVDPATGGPVRSISLRK